LTLGDQKTAAVQALCLLVLKILARHPRTIPPTDCQSTFVRCVIDHDILPGDSGNSGTADGAGEVSGLTEQAGRMMVAYRLDPRPVKVLGGVGASE
jgi:hypothetical protein